MQKFSNRLISLRKEHGLTQEELAKIIKKTRSSVSGYETEGKEPDLETVCLMANYFGVSTDYLLGYSDRPSHTEDVFYNDTVNFKKHFENLPADMRPAEPTCVKIIRQSGNLLSGFLLCIFFLFTLLYFSLLYFVDFCRRKCGSSLNKCYFRLANFEQARFSSRIYA